MTPRRQNVSCRTCGTRQRNNAAVRLTTCDGAPLATVSTAVRTACFALSVYTSFMGLRLHIEDIYCRVPGIIYVLVEAVRSNRTPGCQAGDSLRHDLGTLTRGNPQELLYSMLCTVPSGTSECVWCVAG